MYRMANPEDDGTIVKLTTEDLSVNILDARPPRLCLLLFFQSITICCIC